MRALTLKQPYPAAVVAGLKTVETRSWKTSYRGLLGFHAGIATDALFRRVSARGWEPTDVARLIPDFRWRTNILAGFAGRNGYRKMPTAYVGSQPMPFGALVAVCDLVDVVQIVGPGECRNGGYHVCVASYGALAHSPLHSPWPDGETEHDVTDQIPFGDFTPGRYAWMLDNVRALPEPIPCKGRQGLWSVPDDIAEQVVSCVR